MQTEEKFLDLVHSNQSIIHKICFVYCDNFSNREDLYQEITLQLWKSYKSFKGLSSFSTWMYRVALNTAINMTKKPAWLSEYDRSNEPYIDIDSEQNLSEDLKLLYQGISRLEKVEKALILLWLEDNSYQEIADTIGISPKNVSVKLVRIKAKLAEIIEKLK